MATPNYGLPILSGTETYSLKTIHNALSNATDSALATIGTTSNPSVQTREFNFANQAGKTGYSGTFREGDTAYFRDTDSKELYNGTSWVSNSVINNVTSINPISGVAQTLPPANAQLIYKFHYAIQATNISGVTTFNFPTAFPNGVIGAWITTMNGTGTAGVINNTGLSKTSASIIFPGVGAISVGFTIMAVGW